MSKLLKAALQYAKLGWKVLPLHHIENGKCTCNGQKGCKPGKHPRWHKDDLTNGLTNATTEEEQIKKWWDRWKNANIGVVTGGATGIFALDIDIDDEAGINGLDTLNDLIKKHGELPLTVTSKTGSGGLHILFKYPKWDISNSVKKVAGGIDIRGDRGYFVAYPSNHISGNSYEWMHEPNNTPVADAPKWLLDIFQMGNDHAAKKRKKSIKGRIWKDIAEGEPILEGGRNDNLFRIGSLLRSKGASQEDIFKTLLEINDTRVKPSLDEGEIFRIAQSSASYDIGDDREKSLLFFPDTDYGNAERLIERHGADLKYSPHMKAWFVWDGVKWSKDETSEIYRRALETMRVFGKEAAKILEKIKKELASKSSDDITKKEKDELKEKIKMAEKRCGFAKASENKSKLEAMIVLAGTVQGMPITIDQLDKDKYLINLKNGTYDLKKKELREHRREDLITKVTNAEYSTTTHATRWKQFIEEVMDNDKSMVDYIQRVCGLLLSGDTSEEYLFIPYGSGGNGKSKFMTALLHVLGDYGQQAPTSLFMAKRTDKSGPNPDLVRIRGARLVSTSETESGKSLDEGLVKTLTGNDLITTRDLYEGNVSFRPEAKFFVSTNHKPMIKGTDNGIWRRVLLIPFEISFKGKQKDPRLEEKLIAEANGILSWMIEGFSLWQDLGVEPPDKIVASTAGYREEMDSLGSFFDDCCIIHLEATTPIKDLYATYQIWCTEEGEKTISNKLFKQRLEERGIEQKRTNKGRFWNGIGLINSYPHLVNQKSDKSDKNDKKIDKSDSMKKEKIIPIEKFQEKSVTPVTLSPSNSSDQIDLFDKAKKEAAVTVMDREEGEL
jgi:putative DNA primase/helicase